MPRKKSQSVELTIPSGPGFEKVAMETAASLAKKIGLPADRIEDLRTAVSEACLNAIEHGNQQDQKHKVVVLMAATDSELEISVRDQGAAFVVPDEAPNITTIIEEERRSRGWGIYLIRSLVDEVEFRPLPKGGNVVRMVIHLTAQE